jgi:hypothetical protein
VDKELLIWMIFGPFTYKMKHGNKSLLIKTLQNHVREDFILLPKLEINSSLLPVATENTDAYATFIQSI